MYKINRITVTVSIRTDARVLLCQRIYRREPSQVGLKEPCGEVVKDPVKDACSILPQVSELI